MLTDELPELSMVHPMPGFPGLKRFVLVRLEEQADADGAAPPTGAEADAAAITEVAEAAAAGAAEVAAAVGSGELDDAPLLFELRSLETPDIRFLVGSPAAFFPEYEVDIDQQASDELKLQDATEALVLVILSVGKDPQSTTANLLAPLVINARNRWAAQVIQTGSDWPVRAAVA